MSDSEEIPYLVQVLMYIGFQIVLLFGALNKLLFNPKSAGTKYEKQFKGLLDSFEEIYFYYVYRRVSDCSHAPVLSRAGSKIWLSERITEDYGWTFYSTGKKQECVNLGSFNYLGLVESTQTQDNAIAIAVEHFGVSTCSPTFEMGRTSLHSQLEKLTAEFLGMEDAITFGAGFATNCLNLPPILSGNSLVMSDEKNHASIILGLRTSKARILKYKHKDFEDLESKIVANLSANHKNGGRLFSKLFIVTEGIYSMDGTIINLPKLIDIKKKYRAYLFIDDAHGVGVLGRNGKGICDFYDVNPTDVDMLMGTYSKAFASNGGYIAGRKVLIDYLRFGSFASYGSTMPPAAVQKAICSIGTLMNSHVDERGNILVHKLKRNARYLRTKLKDMGLIICGHEDSYIIPWILGSVSAVSFCIRELKKRDIAAAGVVYPATPLLASRIRFNVSASHTLKELDQVIMAVKEITHNLGLNHNAI